MSEVCIYEKKGQQLEESRATDVNVSRMNGDDKISFSTCYFQSEEKFFLFCSPRTLNKILRNFSFFS